MHDLDYQLYTQLRMVIANIPGCADGLGGQPCSACIAEAITYWIIARDNGRDD